MKAAILIMITCALGIDLPAHAFDHAHTQWDRLVSHHVRWNDDKTASRVDYNGFMADRSRLETYLDTLSEVPRSTYDTWTRNQKLSFLLNSYNAFTIELILTRYPDLDSIKDLGSLFTSPWKKKFFTLLDGRRHLDWIEQTMIREPGIFDDPRIHAAVNCASIGCPALWDRAFTPEDLDATLETAMQRFLSDRSRNRFSPSTNTLELSRIFDWYEDDFTKGFRGSTSLHQFIGLYADYLTDEQAYRKQITDPATPIRFLAYDWHLNNLP